MPKRIEKAALAFDRILLEVWAIAFGSLWVFIIAQLIASVWQ